MAAHSRGGMDYIGNYALEGLIGQGGNGVVYRSAHPVLQRPVAIKVLRAELARDPTLRALFVHEARLTLDLNHPGIVNVYDVDQDGERVFLVMEYFEHGSLAAALGRGGLALPAGLELATQAAEALAFAHAQGVVHGDVKSSNILLRDACTPVVADFGLAVDRMAPTPGGDVAVSSIRGTPAYLAPEQLRGCVPDQRSDLYAFGVLLYELASGRRPFVGPVEEILQQHQTALPVPLEEHNPAVPPALAALVAGMLAKDPARRPRSMAAVAAALRQIQAALSRRAPRSGSDCALAATGAQSPSAVAAAPSSGTLTVPVKPRAERARLGGRATPAPDKT